MVPTILDATYQKEKQTFRRIIITWFFCTTLTFIMTYNFKQIDVIWLYLLTLVVTGGIPLFFFFLKMRWTQ